MSNHQIPLNQPQHTKNSSENESSFARALQKQKYGEDEADPSAFTPYKELCSDKPNELSEDEKN